MSDDEINDVFPWLKDCLAEAERDFVTSSYPGRLLGADDLEISRVRVKLSSGPGEPACWIAYTDPQAPEGIQAQNPSVLELWDHPSKHRHLILRCWVCPASADHLHLMTET